MQDASVTPPSGPDAETLAATDEGFYCRQLRSIWAPVLPSRNSHSRQLLGVATGKGELPGVGTGGMTGPRCSEVNAHTSWLSAVYASPSD